MLPLIDCVVVAPVKIAPPRRIPVTRPASSPAAAVAAAAAGGPSWENVLPATDSVVPWKKIPPPAPRPPNATCELVPPPSPLPPWPPAAESWENVLAVTDSVVPASAKIAPPSPMPPVPVVTPSAPAAPSGESLVNAEFDHRQ